MKFKKCIKCGEEKENTLDFFPKAVKNGKIYTRNKCKECAAKDRKSPEVKAKERENARTWILANPERDMLKRAKARAIRDNIEFSIEIEDIKIPEKCPILGIKLKQTSGKAQDCSPSLDKINPKLGYIKGNVRVISRLANIMKAHATREQLIEFSNNIIHYLDDKR